MRFVFVILCLSAAYKLFRLVDKATTRDFFSPLSLLFFFWLAPLILSFTNLSALQRGLSFEAVAVLTLTTLLLCFVSLAASLQIRHLPLERSLQAFNASPFCTTPGLLISGLLFAVAGVAIYYSEFQQGVPFLEYARGNADLADLHRVGKTSRLEILGHAIFVSGSVFFYAALASRSKFRRSLLILLSAIPICYGVAKTSKSDIFLPLLSYAALYYYFRKASCSRVPVARMLLLLVLLGSAMMLLSDLRLSGVKATSASTYADLIQFDSIRYLPQEVTEIASIIYGYTALNFQNFSDYLAHADGSMRLGTSLLRPFFSIFLAGDLADAAKLPRAQWHYVSNAAVVGTFLRDLYIEGGIWDCIAGSFLYSALVNWVYVRFRKTGSSAWLLVYTVFLFPWAWLSFQNAFSVLQFYVDAFYLFMIFGVSRAASRACRMSLRASSIGAGTP